MLAVCGCNIQRVTSLSPLKMEKKCQRWCQLEAHKIWKKNNVESYNLVWIGRTDPIHIMFVVCFGDIFFYPQISVCQIWWHHVTSVIWSKPAALRSVGSGSFLTGVSDRSTLVRPLWNIETCKGTSDYFFVIYDVDSHDIRTRTQTGCAPHRPKSSPPPGGGGPPRDWPIYTHA